MLAHIVDIAQHIAPTYVALGAYGERNAEALTNVGLKANIIHCPAWSGGMGATIAHSIASVPACDGVLIMLADQYAVTLKDCERLVNAWRSDRAVIACAQYNGTVGVPAIFPASLHKHLKRLVPEAGAKKLIRQQSRIQPVALENAAFDLDFIEDLSRLRVHFEHFGVAQPIHTSES